MSKALAQTAVYEEFVGQFSEKMLMHVLMNMLKLETTYGPAFTQVFMRQLMAGIVGNVVMKRLQEDLSGLPDDKKLDVAMENFAIAKVEISDAVALGVQTAMTKFSGSPVEYYCQIRPTPEPMNRKPC